MFSCACSLLPCEGGARTSAAVLARANGGPIPAGSKCARWAQPSPRVPTLLIEVGRRQACQRLEGLQILFTGRADHAFRKTGSRRTAVPAGRVEPVSHELFVQRVGAVARPVCGGVPVAGGVGREGLVDPDQAPVDPAELELRVGEEQPAGSGVLARAAIQVERQIAQPLRLLGAEAVGHCLKGDVLVVSALALGGRREDRLRQAIGLNEAGGKPDAADLLRLPVFCPAGTGDVPARHALERNDFGLLHDDRAPDKRGPVGLKSFGKALDLGLDEMVLDVGESLKPEVRELSEDLALVGDAGGENAVEGGDAVARDEEERFSEIIELTDLTAPREARPGKVSFHQGGHRAQTLARREWVGSRPTRESHSNSKFTIASLCYCFAPCV